MQQHTSAKALSRAEHGGRQSRTLPALPREFVLPRPLAVHLIVAAAAVQTASLTMSQRVTRSQTGATPRYLYRPTSDKTAPHTRGIAPIGLRHAVFRVSNTAMA